MYGISRSVLYSAGPDLPRPSIFIHLFYGAPKRPGTFENLIEIKRVDENN